MTTNTNFPPRTQMETKRLRDRITRVAESWEPLPFDVAAAAGQRAAVFGTFTGSVYAAGGVTIPGTSGAKDVMMQPWTDGAGSVYLFKWNPFTSKMFVTDWTGVILAPGTDISDVVAQPFIASFGAGSASAIVPTGTHRVTGAGRLTRVEFEVATTFPASTTNFWTLTARLRRAAAATPQTEGELLGSYSSEERTLFARSPVVLFTNDLGVAVRDDDRVLLTATPTGSPVPLAGALGWVRIQRRVD